MNPEFYASHGVSATKEDVHKAVSRLSKGLFPGAFCKILPDACGDESWCMAMHADGAGTKSVLAYLMAQETGDPGWFSGIAQDALVMNTDDLLCIGAVQDFYLSNTIGRDSRRIGSDTLAAVIDGYDWIIDRLADQGIRIHMTGGETADVGDLVRTMICDSTVWVRMRRDEVIDASRIRPGLAIVGLASFGQTTYEDRENSGIGSNGLTAARHLLLHPDYRKKAPETFSDRTAPHDVYCGRWHLTDGLQGSTLTIGEALLSPTRTYLPVMAALRALPDLEIYGAVHCTGGGQAKCRGFGRGIRYVKDKLFPLPPVFVAIAETSRMSREEMGKVFNLGHRLELMVADKDVSRIIEVCSGFNLAAQRIGYTEAFAGAFDVQFSGANEVILEFEGQSYSYRS